MNKIIYFKGKRIKMDVDEHGNTSVFSGIEVTCHVCDEGDDIVYILKKTFEGKQLKDIECPSCKRKQLFPLIKTTNMVCQCGHSYAVSYMGYRLPPRKHIQCPSCKQKGTSHRNRKKEK